MIKHLTKIILLLSILCISEVGVSKNADAQCCGCAEAAYAAGSMTTANVNAFTAAAITAQTAELIIALQGVSSDISGNVRGTIVGNGQVTEGLDSHQTEREIQNDRVKAANTYQFSTPLCRAAAGQMITTAANQALMPTTVRNAQENDRRTTGPLNPLTEPMQLQKGRTGTFCRGDIDPVCHNKTTRLPNADKLPDATLTNYALVTNDDQVTSAQLIQNLSLNMPTAPISSNQNAMPGGSEAYMRRIADDTKLNLAKDALTSILMNRKLPSIDNRYYNSVAPSLGLPVVDRDVSIDEEETAEYLAAVPDAGVDLTRLDSAALLRQIVMLQGVQLQQSQRAYRLDQRRALLEASMLAKQVESSLIANSGKLN